MRKLKAPLRRPELSWKNLLAQYENPHTSPSEVIGLIHASVGISSRTRFSVIPLSSLNDLHTMIDFLTQVGDEVDVVEPNESLRQEARKVLARHVCNRATLFPHLRGELQARKQQALAKLLVFYGATEKHSHQALPQSRDLESVHSLLDYCLNCYDHVFIAGEIIKALVMTWHFEAIVEGKFFQAIPHLYQCVAEVNWPEWPLGKTKLCWPGWENLYTASNGEIIILLDGVDTTHRLMKGDMGLEEDVRAILVACAGSEDDNIPASSQKCLLALLANFQRAREIILAA